MPRRARHNNLSDADERAQHIALRGWRGVSRRKGAAWCRQESGWAGRFSARGGVGGGRVRTPVQNDTRDCFKGAKCERRRVVQGGGDEIGSGVGTG